MLEAHYQRREGRVQAGWTQAVLGGSRRLRLVSLARGGDPGQEPDASGDELLDLSSRGMKIRTADPAPRRGDGLLIELRHPEVRGSVTLRGEVRWTEPDGSGRHRVGVAFVEVRDTTAVALEQLIALELGSAVLSPTGRVGFLAASPDGQSWTCYDLDRVRLGRVHREGAGVSLIRGGEPQACPDLSAALEAAFGVAGLRVSPPVEPA